MKAELLPTVRPGHLKPERRIKEKPLRVLQDVIIEVLKDFSPGNIKRILTPLKMKVQHYQAKLIKLLKLLDYKRNYLYREKDRISESVPQGKRTEENQKGEGMAQESDPRVRGVETTIRNTQRDSKNLPERDQQELITGAI
jgi:hypothetical protein